MVKDYKIYIDTTKRGLNRLIFYENQNVLEVVEGHFDIVCEIRNLLRKYEVEVEGVAFDYNQGPGESFTGLKVGCVISNVLNLANNKIDSSRVKLPNYGREPNISVRKSK